MKIVNVNGTHWTIDRVRELIIVNDKAAVRAMLRIYDYQTSHEQVVDATIDNNNVGFNHGDAPKMSGIAKFYKVRGYVTPKQMFRVRKMMPKYAGQLLNLMEMSA